MDEAQHSRRNLMFASMALLLAWFWEAEPAKFSVFGLHTIGEPWKFWAVGAVAVVYLLIRFVMSPSYLKGRQEIQEKGYSEYKKIAQQKFDNIRIDRLIEKRRLSIFMIIDNKLQQAIMDSGGSDHPDYQLVQATSTAAMKASKISTLHVITPPQQPAWAWKADIKFDDENSRRIYFAVHPLGRCLVRIMSLWKAPECTFIRLELYVPLAVGLCAVGIGLWKTVTVWC
ncbi:hypothetical protein ACMHYO_16185 [Allopusillimonas ginsengisoli]|uniref:hypothetical protein n=1 Tax=Allopusillimonas ginsengisoli TaxID=453575 RepID=UPI0039C4097E